MVGWLVEEEEEGRRREEVVKVEEEEEMDGQRSEVRGRSREGRVGKIRKEKKTRSRVQEEALHLSRFSR